MSTNSTPSVVAGRGSVLHGLPFVARPVQPERSRRLNAKHIAAFDAPHLPGKLPDFEQLTIRAPAEIPFRNFGNQIGHLPIAGRSEAA